MSLPFRLEFRAACVVGVEYMLANASANAALPRIRKQESHTRPLAIVGGGPLVVNDLEELRAWPGDVWGINHTAQWLNEQGVKATLFSVDPEPFETNVERAIVASCCDPRLLATIRAVEVFDIVETHPENGFSGGRFSSTRAPIVALFLGYRDVQFFGCEGSFTSVDHVDRNDEKPDQLIVRAGGADYRTCPQFMVQCEELRQIFVFDGVFKNRSHGLLKAMIDHPDTWEVVGVSEALKAHLEEVNGKHGLYDQPFVPLQAVG